LKKVERVTIVGGGLSGLALGLRLRRLGVACDVWEVQGYPRHRVCGEFLSGRGRQVLAELGVLSQVEQEGGVMGRSVAFFSAHGAAGHGELPEPALCVSRYRLDAILAEALVAEGGVLRVGQRFVDAMNVPGVVRATGREPRTEDGGWRWLGLKAHALGAELTADLEMHFHPDAYVGLCRVEGGRVNVCGLFRSRTPLSDLRQTWRERLRGIQGSPLWERLRNVEFDESSFCAVAALPLRPGRMSATDEVRIGDGCGMIPPVTGNGMSIALESASLAAPRLSAWSRGEVRWESVRSAVHDDWERTFGRRLKWAGALQTAVMNPVVLRLWGMLFPVLPGLWRAAYFRTR
jgi:flavin-dependent dehydrogenase